MNETSRPSNRQRVWLALCVSAQLVSLPVVARAGDKVAVQQTKKNTLVFDHCGLQFYTIDGSAPDVSVHHLPVLKLKNDEWFQIRIQNTDPRHFNYTLTAVSDAEIKAVTRTTGETIVTDRLTETVLTMRHHEHFRQYALEISLAEKPRHQAPREIEPQGVAERETPLPPRTTQTEKAQKLGTDFCREERGEDGQPRYRLVSVIVPFGVETEAWNVSFSGGIAFSGLTDEQYFIKTNAEDDTKTVEVDEDARDRFRPDVVALANLTNPDILGDFGLAFGFGIGDDARPRYFFGGSYTVGHNFILNAGWVGGNVARLPTGQQVGMAPINGDTTVLSGADQPTRFRSAFYAGIAFTFVNRRDEFDNKLKVTQKAEDQQADSGDEEGQGEGNGDAKLTFDKKKLEGLKTTTGELKLPMTLSGVKEPKTLALTAVVIKADGTEVAKVHPEANEKGEFEVTLKPAGGWSAGKYTLVISAKKGNTAVAIDEAEFPFDIAN